MYLDNVKRAHTHKDAVEYMRTHTHTHNNITNCMYLFVMHTHIRTSDSLKTSIDIFIHIAFLCAKWEKKEWFVSTHGIAYRTKKRTEGKNETTTTGRKRGIPYIYNDRCTHYRESFGKMRKNRVAGWILSFRSLTLFILIRPPPVRSFSPSLLLNRNKFSRCMCFTLICIALASNSKF